MIAYTTLQVLHAFEAGIESIFSTTLLNLRTLGIVPKVTGAASYPCSQVHTP